MRKKLFFLLVIAAGPVVAQVNLSANLTACYNMNGNANDAINNLNGVLSMVTTTVNRFGAAGTAYYFNGTASSYIELPDNTLLKPDSTISISCWVKPEVVGDGYIVFTKNTLSSYFEAYNLCQNYNTAIGTYGFMANKSGPNGYNIVQSTSPIVPFTWYHLVMSINNSYIKLYVNGSLQASASVNFSGFDYTPGKKVYVGCSNEPSFDTPYKGTIDNLRFYNRILTTAEVLQLYQSDPECIVATGISRTRTNALVPISPNPSTGIFTLEDAEAGEPYEITDMRGKLILLGKFSSGNTEINLSDKANGVYVLKARSNGKTLNTKLVKVN